MAKSIAAIQGVGPKYDARVCAIGCGPPDKLVRAGTTRNGRREVAAKIGIAEAVILRYVDIASLFRIKGVVTQCAESRATAGMDAAKELEKL